MKFPGVDGVAPELRAPMLRREFPLSKPVVRATLRVSGLGFHSIHLNGEKVGDHILSAPRLDYRKRVLFETFDVTAQLRQGLNAVGVILGNGCFNPQKKYWGWRMQWYGSPRLNLQLDVEYGDGTRDRIISDDTWRWAWSPITFNDINDGEDYDARLEQAGWDRPGFDDSSWPRVNVVPAPGGELLPSIAPASVIAERIPAVGLKEVAPATYVYDFGKNLTGFVRLRVKGPRGTAVKIRFAEEANPDGSLNRFTMREARAEENYILRGEGEEVFEPRFTYRGFQFAELTGFPGKPDLATLEACFVHDDVKPAGYFECSNELINRIHRAVLQTQLMNLQMGVPTDDTQRPERLGWGADAMISAEEAMSNLGMARFYEKWLGDFRDNQVASGLVGMIVPRPGIEEDLVWSAAFPAITWMHYVRYGDRTILEQNYPALKRYLGYLESRGRAEVAPRPKGSDPLNDPPEAGPIKPGYLQNSQWGDHYALADGWAIRSGLPLSIATAFYYYDATLMVKMAEALGEKEDAARFHALAGRIREAYNARFFDSRRNSYDDGTQGAQSFALAFGLVPEGKEAAVLETLLANIRARGGHSSTGYVGTWCLVDVLTRYGRSDEVWRLANLTDFPSWGFIAKNHSTFTENWKGTNSLSHVGLGAPIDAWFYSTLAGIRQDENAPGFRRVSIAPFIPEDLDHVTAWVDTPRGHVESSWKKENGQLEMSVVVPSGSVARIRVPSAKPEEVREAGHPIAEAPGLTMKGSEAGALILEATAGRYRFTAPLAH